MDDKVFKNDAKNIVDVAFDNRLFKDDLTRDDFNSFEDLLCFICHTFMNGGIMITLYISKFYLTLYPNILNERK